MASTTSVVRAVGLATQRSTRLARSGCTPPRSLETGSDADMVAMTCAPVSNGDVFCLGEGSDSRGHSESHSAEPGTTWHVGFSSNEHSTNRNDTMRSYAHGTSPIPLLGET